MSEPFDLRALVRQVLRSSATADPAAAAKSVAQAIPDAHRDEALEQALPQVVHNVISGDRRHTVIATGTHHQAATTPTPAQPSRKVRGIREWFLRALDEDWVNTGLKEWKFLGDCSVSDLMYAAVMREDYARRSMVKAGGYRHLAALLDEHDVSTVRDLPEDVLAETLTRAVA